MRERISSWMLFWLMGVGVLLLMVGQRPQLQRTEHHDGPGPIISVVGHSLTWTTAAALTVRLVRSTRASLRAEAAQRQREYDEAMARSGQARPPDGPADQV